jgi:hypothetical protein
MSQEFALKSRAHSWDGWTQAGAATKLLSQTGSLYVVDFGDDHGGQDRFHTG